MTYRFVKTKPSSNHHHTQGGNVFFYIFIAIALFAALSYVVSQNSSGNANVFTDEQAKLAAQEIIEYGNTVASAVQKLRLRGCSDTEVSFENDVVTARYNNTNSPPDKFCHVFDKAGGGINWANPPSSFAFDHAHWCGGKYCFSNGIVWNGVASTCNDSSCVDPLLLLHSLDEKTCETINNILGYTNNILEDTNFSGSDFKGELNTYTSTLADEINGSEATAKTSGCFLRNGDGQYVYTQVLIAR